MDPTNSGPERIPTPNVPQFNAAPDLGNMAANMASNSPNAMPTMPELAPNMPEVAPLGLAERLSNPEVQRGPGRSTSTPVPMIPVPTQPVVVPQTPAPITPATTTTTTPATAADEDLIEKEWVEQAKKVISSTKNDPHERARLVAELMRDYVRKRYGKEVGKAPDDL